jgi:hypothetical protein
MANGHVGNGDGDDYETLCEANEEALRRQEREDEERAEREDESCSG